MREKEEVSFEAYSALFSFDVQLTPRTVSQSCDTE